MLFNDRLDSILKEAFNQFLGLPTFDEFNEDVREQKKQESRESIINSTKTKLKKLSAEIQKEIKSIISEINVNMFPALSKEIDTIYQTKTLGAIEYQNALMVAKEKPKQISKIIQQAIEQNRFDFAFSLIDLLLWDKTIEQSYRFEIERVQNGLNEQLGFTELRNKKEKLELENAEVNRYIDIINTNPINLESEIKSRARVSKAMYENGQLEKKMYL